MIVVTSRIPVAAGRESEFEERFRRRAHRVDRNPGFIRNEVHRPRPMKFDRRSGEFIPDPAQPAFYEVKTWWRSFEDFEDWTKTAAFAEAHENRAPTEMFAGPNALDVHEVFIESPRSGNI